MQSFITIAKEKSSEDLLKMIYELDIWDPQMLKACENELKIRNQLPEDFITKRNEIIQQEEAELAIGKDASTIGIIIGWLGILGFIGLYMGYRYSYSKVRSKYTNKQYFKYSEESRKDGKYILNASIFGLIIGLIYTMIKVNNSGI